MYRGQVLPNNSAIFYNYDSSDDLLCVTELRPCCIDSIQQGEWYSPYNSNVSVSRYTNGTVLLPSDHVYSNGVYHCAIPNAMNITLYIYVGVYNRAQSVPGN